MDLKHILLIALVLTISASNTEAMFRITVSEEQNSTNNVCTSIRELDTCFMNKADEAIHDLAYLYPGSELIDIYKSVYQDVMGSEHMIVDSCMASNDLDWELANMDTLGAIPAYVEKCGINGNYVRISLLAVRDGLITKEELLNSFLMSAGNDNPKNREELKKQWQIVKDLVHNISWQNVIDKVDQQSSLIDSVVTSPDYSVHHSSNYTNWYSPHYRIVSKEIYERYLQSKIEGCDTTKIYFTTGVFPTYPGGMEAMKDDLRMNYGELEPILQQFCGTWLTLVSAIVEKDGSLSNIEIIRFHDKYFDHHALRAVRSLKKFQPATVNGKSVRSKIIIPVRFSYI